MTGTAGHLLSDLHLLYITKERRRNFEKLYLYLTKFSYKLLDVLP